MVDVILLAEGQTEEAFTKRVLAPELGAIGVFVYPRCIPTSEHGRGGALNWARVRRFVRNTLLERNDTYVTTFFDLYSLTADFPGLRAARRLIDPLDRARDIERGFHQSVITDVNCRPERFIPHVQPYEFESLLFTDIDVLSQEISAWQPQLRRLREARQRAQSPEHINDGPQTHPSARLIGILDPSYEKVVHGAGVAERLGTARIRHECAHFGAWLARIEALPPLRVEG